MKSLEDRIKNVVRDIRDFPKEGIVFKDITPLLLDAGLSREVTAALAGCWRASKPDAIAGIESRGFIWGAALAWELAVPFVPIRKKGKLPAPSHSFTYDLEYGTSEIEVHKDAIRPGQKIVIHDDLLATGGTATGASGLVRMCGGTVCGFSFVVELSFLNARPAVATISKEIHSLVKY